MPFPFPPSDHDEMLPSGGIVRAARRPKDFIVAGPAPCIPEDCAHLLPTEGEDLCWLAGNWRLLQRMDGHRTSLDDLVTADLALLLTEGASPRRVLDLGCGIGSVLMFLLWGLPYAQGVGVEAQEVSARLARRSFAFNGAEQRAEIRLGDIRDPASFTGLDPFDLVTGTPPYFPIGDGPQSAHVQRGPCRFEHRGGIEDYCLAAAPRLAPHAPFVACEAFIARSRVEPAAKAAGLAIVYWRDVVPREGKTPLLSIFAMRLAGHAGPRVDAPPLVVRDRQGQRTPEFKALRLRCGMPA